MSYEDFIKTWNKVMMVHINRDSYNSIDSEVHFFFTFAS